MACQPQGQTATPCPCNPTGSSQGLPLLLHLGACEHGVTPDEVTMPAWPQPWPALNGAKSGSCCWMPASQGGQLWVWARVRPLAQALRSSR